MWREMPRVVNPEQDFNQDEAIKEYMDLRMKEVMGQVEGIVTKTVKNAIIESKDDLQWQSIRYSTISDQLNKSEKNYMDSFVKAENFWTKAEAQIKEYEDLISHEQELKSKTADVQAKRVHNEEIWWLQGLISQK